MGAAGEDKQAMLSLLKELEEAQDHYAQAKTAEADAQHEATKSLNLLNRVTAKIDAWYAEQKKDAPRDTDWGRRKGEEVTQ